MRAHGLELTACHGRALRRVVASLALLVAGAAHGTTPTVELQQAARSLDGKAPQTVSLPDKVGRPAAAKGAPLQPTYRLEADLGPTPGRTAIYLPGVFANARIAVNGHVVDDRIRDPLPPAPRGADRLVFAPVSAEFLRPGPNAIEIMLADPRQTWLSRVWIGDEDTLHRMRDRKELLMVGSTVVAAAVTGALSLCMLVLWARRPADALFAYFGIGGLLWALHTAWTVLPDPLLEGHHFEIWWTMGFPLFIVPLVIFCVRLAGWRLPRFERAMGIGILLGPLILYGAHHAGVLQAGKDYFRLVWIGAVAIGVRAVARYALQQRNAQGYLLLFTGAVALLFGVRDWLVNRVPTDNNPIFLTNFAGLLFIPLVAWILIDRFVRTTTEVERLNADLEARVASKSAELLRALDDMRSARDRAQAADRAKSAFLAAASHDLRQPAHALGLYVAALRGERLAGRQGETVERMSASVGALDAMFSALLDISRMDSGAVTAEIRPFELGPLLHRVGSEFAQQAADKGLRLSVRVSEAARRRRALSDPMLVERIVRNLVDNAIKYTAAGGMLLTCRLAGGDRPHWRLEVWDTGAGIAAAHRDRVFDEFFQVEHVRGERSNGLGLGLSIVRRLASLLGHPLRLDSVVGRGSRFALIVPATATPAHNTDARPSSGSIEGLGVGVLDDDPQVCDAMQSWSERGGCRVCAAHSLVAFLAEAGASAAERLQVLIVDLDLPGSSGGLDAIATLRRAGAGDQPALIVTGAASPERLAELESSGFDWLIKPAPPARLRSWLIVAARRVRQHRAAAAPEARRDVPAEAS
jgi:signal transduction histidine kinase